MSQTLHTTLANLLPASSFFLTTVGNCEVAAAVLPQAQIYDIPFDGFVMSDTNGGIDLGSPSSRTRFDYLRDQGISGVILERPDEIDADLITVDADYVADDQEHNGDIAFHSAFAALSMATHRDMEAIAFSSLPGRSTADVNSALPASVSALATASGILTFLRAYQTSPLRRIMIRVPDNSTLDSFMKLFGYAQVEEDPLEKTRVQEIPKEHEHEWLETFLDERSVAEKGAPKSIPHYDFNFNVSPAVAVAVQMGDRVYAVDPNHIDRGHVRLITNSILDRAMDRVPPFIRSPKLGLRPPYVYARLKIPSLGTGNDPFLTFKLIQGVVLHTQNSPPNADHISGEIGLVDTPREYIGCANDLFRTTGQFMIPARVAEFYRKISGSTIIPRPIYERVMRNCPSHISTPFNPTETDRMLTFFVLHECAEIFWSTLPKRMQEKWMEYHRLDMDIPGDISHYRNLLRVFIENKVFKIDEAQEFFAREIFADKLALYWIDDAPLTIVANGPIHSDREIAVFEDAMNLARRRYHENGSAFII